MPSLQSSTFSTSLFLINCITHKVAPNASESKDSGQPKKKKEETGFLTVLLLTSPYTCILCPMFSLNPSVNGLASLCTCWRKDRLDNHPIVRFACLCHMICEESFFLSLLSSFLSLVAFYKRSAVTHNKFYMLTFPRWSSCFERTDDTLST